jgi:hypothetical protein
MNNQLALTCGDVFYLLLNFPLLKLMFTLDHVMLNLQKGHMFNSSYSYFYAYD